MDALHGKRREHRDAGAWPPYEHDGDRHEYLPDFIVRLAGTTDRYLILETKGFDPVADVKKAAAERWVNAVNADGSFGHWAYRLAYQPADIPHFIAEAAEAAKFAIGA